ncbi:hypothetical protein U0035_12535 [Niabella yanshanensis]|uniref:DUF3316 domain-containing protein n=1 Tax=Niabella yanshanensis TaxID=577386 RepID=A0ABZ0W1Q0_9BACT|nr:hypothetical protein [Niabella yanshanensis]WQD36494.1 hypothetical protein U0035_12535 [Niabella yanshanensis]
MKYFLLCMLLLPVMRSEAQELYIYTEPASNIPAKSISAKLSANYAEGMRGESKGLVQRYRPEMYMGLSKNFMLRASGTFANMHTSAFKFESASLYGKYRFLSKDEAHRHFRMAAFADASVSKAPFRYDEIALMGNKTGAEAGVIATQLINKLAISGTVSHVQVLDKSRFEDAPLNLPYQAMNYFLSAGYLLFPRKYEDYRQTNFNIYTEILAQQTLDTKRYYVDMAPGVQFIFNSNSKLNLGYRFQLGSDMNRMARSSVQLSFERTFFGAL